MDPLLTYGYLVVVIVVLLCLIGVWLEMMVTKPINDEEEGCAVLSDEDDPEQKMNAILTEV